MKIFRILVVMLAICMLFAGCNNAEEPQSPVVENQTDPVPTDVTYSRNGVSFTLPSDFTDCSEFPLGRNFEFLYANDFVGIQGLRDFKANLGEEISSLELYAAAKAAEFSVEASQKDGIWVISYEDLSQNDPVMYVCAFYEAEDAYWFISSYCPSSVFDTYEEVMWDFVTTAVFE